MSRFACAAALALAVAAVAPRPAERHDAKSPVAAQAKPKAFKGGAADQLWNAVPHSHAAARELKETQAKADLDAYFENRAGGGAVSPDETVVFAPQKKAKRDR